MKNLVTVIKPKVWCNCLSGYIDQDHPHRFFSVAVWKEGFQLDRNKIEKKHDQKQIDTDQMWVTLLELKGNN